MENQPQLSARGTFEVKMIPQQDAPEVGDPSVGRFSLHKVFSGALAGSSNGQMLTVGTPVEGSAVYVAMERFSGTLDGRTGTFALHHTGIMNRGVPQLTISVVPDSGTDELEGVAGTLTIDVADGQHFYELRYTLPVKA